MPRQGLGRNGQNSSAARASPCNCTADATKM